METDRVALDVELEIFHRVPPSEEKDHFVIGRSCHCNPNLEIVDENTVIIAHRKMSAAVLQESR